MSGYRRKRPGAIVVKMKPHHWDDLDDLVERSDAPSRSEAIRAAVRFHREHLIWARIRLQQASAEAS